MLVKVGIRLEIQVLHLVVQHNVYDLLFRCCSFAYIFRGLAYTLWKNKYSSRAAELCVLHLENMLFSGSITSAAISLKG